MTKWTVRRNNAVKGAVEQICSAFGVGHIAATIMLNRGLGSLKAVKEYTTSSTEALYSLRKIPSVIKAFDIIKNTIEQGLSVTIYGDYDVDGVTATVILYKGLKLLGAEVSYFIPDRHTDGYGLNPKAIKTIAENGCSLLITCDNGIASKNEIDYAISIGMQVIILDHHEPICENVDGKKQYIIPKAEAVIDLKLEGIDYPFRELCAGGLCYKFICEFFEYLNKKLVIDDELIVFAALATVCDVVSLRKENRIIVRRGLEIINNIVENKGLQKLVEINNLQGKKITEYTFGFVIGPCINAGGRLELAALAAELFISEDNSKTEELAQRLFELNAQRKEMTRIGCENLVKIADNMQDRVLVLYDNSIDESIAGIIAGRLKEIYNKPAIVLTDGETEGVAKGSGRSIEAYDMYAELSQFRELFVKFGGHKMAAGMSISKKNIDGLRKALNESCKLTASDMEKCYCAEKIINMSDVNIFAARDMEIFKPYGTDNQEPLIAAVNLRIKYLRFVGVQKNIAQLSLTDDTSNTVSAVAFDGEELAQLINDYYGYDYVDEEKNVTGDLRDIRIDIMASIQIDDYNGNQRPKLHIKNVRVSNSN